MKSSISGSVTITPVLVADLLAEGERMPVYVHVIDHPDARVLVDTGITELHPLVADMDPRLRPLSEQDFDLAGVDIVVNTHLHFDHCGGNHLFAGRPIYPQHRELDDARSEDDYTIREWVDAPGVRYVPVDGELELLPGLRLVPAPGHTRGMQVARARARAVAAPHRIGRVRGRDRVSPLALSCESSVAGGGFPVIYLNREAPGWPSWVRSPTTGSDWIPAPEPRIWGRSGRSAQDLPQTSGLAASTASSKEGGIARGKGGIGGLPTRMVGARGVKPHRPT
jgi:N-acyl homoserine lactone hydrolase